jgi:hypothetical protein
MRARIKITIKQLPVLVQSTSSSTRKKIAKRNKRMIKRHNHKEIRLFNAFVKDRRSFMYIASFD